MEQKHIHTEGSEHEETHAHKKPGRQNKQSIIIIIVAVIVIVLAAALVWLYTGKMSQAKTKIFNKIPLPAAIVDMKFLPAKYVLSRIDLAQQLLSAQGAGGTSDPSQVYSQIIDSKKLDVVAAKEKVTVSSSEIDEEYQNILKQYAGGDENAFNKELQDTYHMAPADFKKEVVSQEIEQSDLMLWYNQKKI